MAVRNPCGLKNPVIQNTFGRSVIIQVLNCVFLSNSSVYQNPSVVDSHEICNLFIFTFQLLKRQTMNLIFIDFSNGPQLLEALMDNGGVGMGFCPKRGTSNSII